MPSTSGFQIVAGRIPGERIATATETTDSSTFTAETVIGTITAALVSGRTYRVRCNMTLGSSVVNDTVLVRLREDNISGTLIFANIGEIYTTGNIPCVIPVEVEYTAVSTGNKTFVVSGARLTGTGNIRREASAWPQLFYVDYISG